ncbi:peptidase M20 [Desulfomarina profundi]|uniref:Peptidase M20 n=1 Tax=Desulfomarina profundi TaxID=2772557 RepID=A0A8D5JPZ8_9BACT|nr:M20/M25/M40 family metallo-hydrolase [Desulfomarina profundi]BCL59496.1 peptidase M20 [Desulfomarina profundi]
MREKILSVLAKEEADQFRLLQDLVLQPSYSWFKEGVDRVGRLLAEELTTCGMDMEVIPGEKLGNQLVFRSPATRKSGKQLLLVGHMDTVFPEDSSFNWYKDDGQLVKGPGVIDMKGGLVVAVSAIRALYHCGLLDTIPLAFICNSDEEIGSPESVPLILAEAEKSFAAMVFECGGLDGELVTGRKGKTGYRLDVSGRAGHAAFAGRDKASAVLELAHKTIALEKLNDPDRGVVVNVGVVQGGMGPNSVAEKARAEIDTRFLTEEDASRVAGEIAGIAGSSTIAGTGGVLLKTSSRPPMEQTDNNRALFALVRDQAESMGITVVEELRSGVSDANTIATVGIPVIDGMGPVGGSDHSDREYMIRSSLPEKSRLTALSILACWEKSGREHE